MIRILIIIKQNKIISKICIVVNIIRIIVLEVYLNQVNTIIDINKIRTHLHLNILKTIIINKKYLTNIMATIDSRKVLPDFHKPK